MESKYITRLIPVEDLMKYIIADVSTFCLNSTAYYRNLESKKNKGIGDRTENEIDLEQSRYTTNEALISSWIQLDGNAPTEQDWDTFPQEQQRFVAIVSTVSKVEEFLKKDPTIIQLREKNIILEFKHKLVEYYKPEKKPDNFEELDVYFYKPEKDVRVGENYKEQCEYRFGLRLSDNSNIHSLTFRVNPTGYVDSIHLSGNVDAKIKCKILAMAGRYKINVQGF